VCLFIKASPNVSFRIVFVLLKSFFCYLSCLIHQVYHAGHCLLVLVKTLGMSEICRFKVIYNYVHNLLSFLRKTQSFCSPWQVGDQVITFFGGDKKKH